MALQGSLEDFSLAEILQLISFQRKSGVLRLTSSEASGVLFFEKGNIVSVTDRREKKTDPLLEFLVATNRLSKEQVEQIYAIRAQSKKEFAEIIITGGYLTSKQLTEAVETHARELMPKLLSWKKGVYHFSGDDKTVSRLFFKVPMRTEALLMESMRRIDESARIKQLYSPSAILRRSESTEKPELADEERWVLSLIDGKRAIREILTKSRLGEFETYEVVSDLIQAGLAEVAEWSLEVQPEAEVAQPSRKAKELVPALGVAFVVLLIAMASFGLRWTVKKLHGSPPIHAVATTPHTQSDEQENVCFALDVYKATHGSYPNELAQLVEDGFIDAKAVEGFTYVKSRRGFLLERERVPSPDESPD